MKKIVFAFAIVSCVIFNTLPVWAATEEQVVVQPEIEINDPYVHIYGTGLNMNINSGKAICSIAMRLKGSQDIDYAQITATIKKSTGTIVKTFNQKVEPSLAGKVNWTVSHKLPAKGKYYLQATVKLYKNGKLVETITDKTANKTY